jgi:hypothetical protein
VYLRFSRPVSLNLMTLTPECFSIDKAGLAEKGAGRAAKLGAKFRFDFGGEWEARVAYGAKFGNVKTATLGEFVEGKASVWPDRAIDPLHR